MKTNQFKIRDAKSSVVGLLLMFFCVTGYAQNPAFQLTSTTGGFVAPSMTATQRTAIATPATGSLVYQTDAPVGYYYYNGTAWVQLLAGSNSAVTSISAGTTGLTPNTATTGAVTLAGTLGVANGGTGSSSQNWVDLTTTQTAAGVKTWSNNAIFNDNVGIGTTSPSQKLDVNGNVNVSGYLTTKFNYAGTTVVSPVSGVSTVNLTIPAVPSVLGIINTTVLVSVSDGVSGTVRRARLTSTTNIEIEFVSNGGGATRFNYVIIPF
jgi:hypothetical protein